MTIPSSRLEDARKIAKDGGEYGTLIYPPLTNIYEWPQLISFSWPLLVFGGGSAAERELGEAMEAAWQLKIDVPLTSFSPQNKICLGDLLSTHD